MKKLIYALLFLLITASCTYISEFKKPDVAFKTIEINSFSTFILDLSVNMDITNTNNKPITTKGLRYALSIDDVSVGSGEINDRINIEPLETKEVKIPVRIQLLKVKELITKLLKASSPPYNIKGVVIIETAFGDIEIPYNKSGIITKKTFEKIKKNKN